MKVRNWKAVWKPFCIAAVFFAALLFPRQTAAQIHSGDAKKIDASWEGDGRSFSSFDDSKALKADASYGFKLKTTDQTKTVVVQGKKTSQLPDLELPAMLEKFTWFKTEENEEGKIKIKKTNMEIYQCEPDGSNGRWEMVDLLLTVTKIEKYQERDGYIAIGTDICDCAYVGIEEMTLKSQFYKAGTNTPITLKSNMTLRDIDARQYIGVKADSVKGQYVSRNTKLSYAQENGFHIYYAPYDENYTSQDFTCAGFIFESDNFEYVFGKVRETGPTKEDQYVGSGQNMVRFDSVDPQKYVSKESGERGKSRHAESLSEGWTYEVEQPIAAQIPSAHYYEQFAFRDQIEECLTIEDVKVYGDDKDVTGEFKVTKEKNLVTAVLKNPKDPAFYQRGVYRLEIKVRMNIPENATKEQLDGLRQKWKAHGHYNTSETTITIDNQAETTVDEKTAPTDKVKVIVDLPEVSSGVPGLNITKTADQYEHQAKDRVRYTVKVQNKNENAKTAYFTVQDISLPDRLTLDPNSVQITGIEKNNYTLNFTKNGWILKSKGDYELPQDKTIVITYEAKAEIRANGTLTDNLAQAWAAGVPEKEDRCQVYVNSPKLCMTKEALQKEYKKGDRIFYRAVLENINQGTFMNDVILTDEIQTDGVSIIPGTMAILADGKDITEKCQISYGEDGKSFQVSTGYSLKKGDVLAMSDVGMQKEIYQKISFADEIAVSYQALVESDDLDGKEISNMIKAPVTKNICGEIIREDEEIPSGGAQAGEMVKMKTPKLKIEKQSDRSAYGVGGTGIYMLKVTQQREGVTARNVIISDAFDREGMKISEVSVLFNGKDITDQCKIQTGETSFRIETGKNLKEDDEIQVKYQVLFQEMVEGDIQNTAVAESENGGKDQDMNIVIVRPAVLKIKKTSDHNSYKVGETGIYQLTVTQETEGATARQVVVEDIFEKEGMEIQDFCVKYNEEDITKQCEITTTAGGNRFQIKTMKDLGKKDKITVSYRVLFREADPGTLKNTAAVYAENAEEDQDDHKVEIKEIVPELSIQKTTEQKTYQIGEIGRYQVVVSQIKKGAEAKNITIEDQLLEDRAEILKDTLKVIGPDGTDITDQCRISIEKGSYKIETGKSLSYGEKVTVNYQVKFSGDDLAGETIRNVAKAKGENANWVSAENQVRINAKEQTMNSGTGSGSSFGSSTPKTGDRGAGMWMTMAAAAGACLVFFLKKRYNRKK